MTYHVSMVRSRLSSIVLSSRSFFPLRYIIAYSHWELSLSSHQSTPPAAILFLDSPSRMLDLLARLHDDPLQQDNALTRDDF